VVLHKSVKPLHIMTAGALLCLTGCGAGSRPMSSGNFAGTVSGHGNASSAAGKSSGVAKVFLNPARLTGGGSAHITVQLAHPAPAGGVFVLLTSSDESVLTLPKEVKIPGGEISATAEVSTATVDAATTVGIAAVYADGVAGTSLGVDAATAAPFTVAVHPSTITIAPGKSGAATVTTSVSAGYDHALTLTVAVPAGVSMHFDPKVIPAPGAGTSSATVKVPSSGVTGTHAIHVTASDGTTSSKATLTLKVSASNPGATFRGCWQRQNGHSYQGVQFSVADPGTYSFDAVLYYGTSCNPNNWADEFGFGTPLTFGGFEYTFWFTDFADQTDMSALWHVGSDTSQCVNYKIAPTC
jgi:hypothetical protein